MFNQIFKDVIANEGVVSITTWTPESAHVSNTWNSYLRLAEDKLLIPAAWMTRTEKNVNQNDQVILTLGSKAVQGKMGMGTGFVISGTARFVDGGEQFEAMKAEFPFLTRVLEVTVKDLRQTI